MESVSVEATPSFSVILILDPTVGVVPESMSGKLIAATKSCVAVGCRAEDDGITRITLGSASRLNPGYPPQFSGEIETPSKVMEVQTPVGDTILKMAVPYKTTRLSIWVNDPREPDQIILGVDES